MNGTREELIHELAEIEARKDKLKKVRPHDFFKALPGGQISFWKSTLREKWIFGGNQVGKTINLINYVINSCRKNSEFRWYLGSTSMERSRKVTQKKFYEWVNKDEIETHCRYREDIGFPNDCCVFKNRSVVFFLSYEMDQDKWAGDTIHGVGFDEEPPWHIFTESQKRIIAYNGELIGAMTALKSYTRLVNRIYLAGDPLIGLFSVPLHENHVKHGGMFTDERVQQIINETPMSERPSRIYGIPTYKTGLVYDEWQDREPWIIPRSKEFDIPNHWTRYCGVDPHGSTPQAAICVAVAPHGSMYAYLEVWKKMLIPEFARNLRRIATPIDFEEVLIDNHFSTQKNAETGKTIKQLLMEYGDIMTYGGCGDILARIDMLKCWDRINPATGRPMLQTFESCAQAIWERKRYEWASPVSEKISERRDAKQIPRDKNGHLMNCLEYLAARGGKAGLEYIVPPLSPAMQKKMEYYKEKEELEMEDEYDGDEEYYETVSSYLE